MAERSPVAIDYFGNSRFPRLRQIASRASFRARKRMFDRLLTSCNPKPTDKVLDIGATPDESLPESNYFERLYPFPDRVVVTSVEDASNIEQNFPGVTFVRTEGVTLPFPDRSFDIVFCSAVLEHVGDRNAQREFLREILRVGRSFFLTTPNRWFPIDFHTLLPFVHWLPEGARQSLLRRMGMDFWADTDNLNLVSRRDLYALVPTGATVNVDSLKLLGIPSNLIAIGGPAPAPR